MSITYETAYKTATKYLAQCAGFPAKSKMRLYKQQQTFDQTTNMHELVFVLRIDHPVNVKSDKPLATINESWPLISEITQTIELMKEPPINSFLNTDFTHFARLLADDMGYAQDQVVTIPTTSHYREKDGTDVYNIVIKVKPIKDVPDIAIETKAMPLIREISALIE
jgi:hypothetical protein